MSFNERHGAEKRALVAAARAVDRLRRATLAVLDPLDLTLQQFNVLRILRGAGGPLPVLEIAERMIERTPGITGLLDRLVAKGLIERRRCAEDRRRVLCSIAPAGLAVLAGCDTAITAVDTAVFQDLDDEELARLADLLERVAPAHPVDTGDPGPGPRDPQTRP